MGRSLESPADPRSTGRLPLEIGLPPVDTPWRARFCDLWKKRMDFFWFSSKIHDKRCFNVQRHQIIIECRLLDLKSMQNPLYFGTFSGRVGDICRFGWCLCTLKHRLTRIFYGFRYFFFKVVLLSLIHPKMKVRASNSEKSTNLHARKINLMKFPELYTYFQSRHHI